LVTMAKARSKRLVRLQYPMTWALLAVTNDHFWPPIIVQNRRNKHTFDTYAFTIDLVPLVFEKTCFAGHKFEYKWKTYQKAQTKDVKQKCANERNKESPPLCNLLEQNTTMGGVQGHPGTDQAKVVVRQAHQGAGGPWCGHTPTVSTRPHSSATVACHHAMAVPSGYLK
jgi:hypothetical protein